MQLTSIHYTQFNDAPREWSIQGLELHAQNLLVGVNASGKSKTLHVINNFARLIAGDLKPGFDSAHWTAVFDREGERISYEINVRDGNVESEQFQIGPKLLLDRGAGGKGRIWAEGLGREIDFQTPTTEVAASARRDSVQHPFLDVLVTWAKGVHKFDFRSETLGKTSIAFVVSSMKPTDIDPRDASKTIPIYRRAEKEFAEQFKTAMRTDMARLRYPIDDIGTRPPTSVQIDAAFPGPPIALYVKESDLNSETDQFEMSEGMFRALALLVHLNFAVLSNQHTLILIDDIGEGLDFERSCLLIDMAREKAQSTNVQLVMSTNDRFVMNKVPLEDWSVLRRFGGIVKVYNYSNSKRLFDDFKLTGLSNFDFFAMDFIEGEAKAAE
ncbi:MAG: AAA family ATPase [Tepidisphaeraceae bacterium]